MAHTSPAGAEVGGAAEVVQPQGKSDAEFKVTDVGDPVPGVKVTFAGKSARTNAKGVAVIKLPKGIAKGTRTAVARVTNWQAASATVKTT